MDNIVNGRTIMLFSAPFLKLWGFAELGNRCLESRDIVPEKTCFSPL